MDDPWEDQDKPDREFLVVQTHRWYVKASDKDDAIDRVSDGMGDLAGTEYEATEARGSIDR